MRLPAGPSTIVVQACLRNWTAGVGPVLVEAPAPSTREVVNRRLVALHPFRRRDRDALRVAAESGCCPGWSNQEQRRRQKWKTKPGISRWFSGGSAWISESVKPGKEHVRLETKGTGHQLGLQRANSHRKAKSKRYQRGEQCQHLVVGRMESP